MDPDIIISGFDNYELTESAKACLKEAKNIVLHTARCALADWLAAQGRSFTSLDRLYETASDFDEHISKATGSLEEGLLKAGELTYCVMDTSDETAKALVKAHPMSRVYGGSAFAALELRSSGPVVMLTAVNALTARLSPLIGVLVKEIDDRFLAGEVKLKLEEIYGDDANVFFRMPEGDVAKLAIGNLDRLKHYDHRCACLINPANQPKMCAFECLRLISGTKQVKDDALSEEALAQKLADVVQLIQAGERREMFSEQDVFERAADILSKGE